MTFDKEEYFKKELEEIKKSLIQFNQKLKKFDEMYDDIFDIEASVKVVDGKCKGVRLRVSRLYGNFGEY